MPDDAVKFFKLLKPKVFFAEDEIIDEYAQAAKIANIQCRFITFGHYHSKYISIDEIIQITNNDNSFKCEKIVKPLKKWGLIIFSSGTTGNKKPMVLSYQSLWALREIGFIPKNSRMLHFTANAWISFSMYSIAATRLKCTRVFTKECSVNNIVNVIENHKV